MAVQIGTRRHRANWTQSQLAVQAELNPRQVAQIEAGSRDPQFTTVIKMARALGLHALDELLGPLPLDSARSSGGDEDVPPSS